MTFFDFNSAAEQSSYDLIPKGTVVRVRMTIKPGGYDDPFPAVIAATKPPSLWDRAPSARCQRLAVPRGNADANN